MISVVGQQGFSDRKMLYRQVKDYLLQQIEEGRYKAGELIPPERELSDTLKISRYTVRRGIQELVEEGILHRVQGKGTFVTEEKKHPGAKSNSLGIVMPFCDAEIEMMLLNGMQKALREDIYSINLSNSNNSSSREAEEVRRLKDDGVAGIVLMPSEEPQGGSVAVELKKEDFPFVLIDRRYPCCEADCVMSDNIQGGFIATEYLLSLGHRSIAFLRHSSDETSSMKDRFTGYGQALRKHGLANGLMYSFDFAKGVSEVEKFLNKGEHTAIIAGNSYVAADVVRACRSKGLVIPDDVSIVSFDDLSMVKLLEVPLTTVVQSLEAIGYRAICLLLERIEAKRNGEVDTLRYYTQHYYSTRLIERESCKRLTD